MTPAHGKHPEAVWTVSLDTECPACHKDVDLLTYPDFWDGRGDLACGEHMTPRTDALDVVCPECGHEFEVTCVY